MELLTNAMSWLADNGLLIVNALLSIVGSASVLAKLTPTPKDDAVLAKVKKALDKVALNPLIKKD
tara:strand:+ start:371 stop:565 length:195 start_codon:yes stop_codon:yes gene_type:complete